MGVSSARRMPSAGLESFNPGQVQGFDLGDHARIRQAVRVRRAFDGSQLLKLTHYQQARAILDQTLTDRFLHLATIDRPSPRGLPAWAF